MLFRPRKFEKRVGIREIIAAIVAGITGGWFMIFLGTNIPTLFDFEPFALKGEVVFIFIFFGISFGYHLGKAMTQTSTSFVFVATFFTYVMISISIEWPPIFFGGTSVDYTASAAVPAILLLSLFVSGIIPQGASLDRFISVLGTTVSWPLFWFHIGYVFIYPLFLKVLDSPTDKSKLINFGILALMWVLIIPGAYYVLKKTHEAEG